MKTKRIDKREDGVGVVETQYFIIDSLTLENREKIEHVTLAYETYGDLNENKTNAVLILHALSGDAHAAGLDIEQKNPGWWDSMIGPGRAFDTNKYFVICSNVIGGCKGSTGPSSINPATGRHYALDFPIVTINDMAGRPEAPYRSFGHR